jgi:hypothetical protein
MIKAVSTASHTAGKPLKRLNAAVAAVHRLKPGVNEITIKYPSQTAALQPETNLQKKV